jgi:hypothetical protein
LFEGAFPAGAVVLGAAACAGLVGATFETNFF